MDQAPEASAVLGRALHVPDLRVEHEGCVTEIADDGAAAESAIRRAREPMPNKTTPSNSMPGLVVSRAAAKSSATRTRPSRLASSERVGMSA